jgi:hypothetical protein
MLEQPPAAPLAAVREPPEKGPFPVEVDAGRGD